MAKKKNTGEPSAAIMALAKPEPLALGTLAKLTVTELPKGLKKLTLPPLLKPETIPVGAIVAGKIVALAPSISDRPSMKDSKLIHMKHDSGTEFLLPLTGTIKKAIGGNDGVTANIGKRLVVVRNEDSSTTKYCGPGEPPKKVFMFDVYLDEK